MRELITLLEAGKKLKLKKLPYSQGSLSPVLTQSNIKNHYGKLAKGYVDRYNKGEGDKAFNEAGAFLHNIWFAQFRAPRNGNVPRGSIKTFIDKHFGSFVDFKKDFKAEAMKLQGSSWIYLNRNGGISTIRNHQIRRNIVLLVDWWEHAWLPDYGGDKGRYIDNIWRIIDWEHINKRLGGGVQDE